MERLTEEITKELIRKAGGMLAFSYIPYSHFAVGAALLGESGRIYTGCNVENAGYSGTNCAERTAVFKAVSEGEQRFRAIAILGGKDRIPRELCPPCGVCRQVLQEFCGEDFPIILARNEEEYRIYTLGELLPFGFGPGNLR